MAVTPSNALFVRRLGLYRITGRGVAYPQIDANCKQYYAMLQNGTYLKWLRGGVQ